MVRPLWTQNPGAFYQVTSRGNERKDVFKSKQDLPPGKLTFQDKTLKPIYSARNVNSHQGSHSRRQEHGHSRDHRYDVWHRLSQQSDCSHR